MRATLYIIVRSAQNRLVRRLRRLREPRYLVGAIAGVSYLLFTLFIRQRVYDVRDAGVVDTAARAASASALAVTGAAGGSVLLGVAAFASWVFPFSSGLLEFSRAETAFLFPSPLTRRQLVIYRLMRSQFAVFTGALIMALAYPTGSLFARLRGLIGMWMVMMTSHIFFTGITLARERLKQGRGGASFMWPALVFPGVTVVTVLGALFVRARGEPLNTVTDALDAVVAVTHQPVVSLLLSPFSMLVHPLFAPTLPEFVSRLAGAFVVYGVTLLWLLWADGQSVDMADAVAERQVNTSTRTATRYVVRPLAWMPSVGSSPELFFVWKGVLQTFRTVDRRVLFRIVLIVGWMIAASFFVTRARGLVALVGVFSTWGALFAIFMAPQIVRMDMRQDLAHLELLKTWPVRGAAVVRGEIAWSAAVVTTIAWAFALLAMTLSMVSSSQIPTPNRFAAWTSFIALIPGVVLAQYTMHNAVALMFPAWVPLGASRPRGVDAVGQRLILLAANWLGLVLALLPGILLSLLLSVVFRPMLGPIVLPLGAILTTAIVVGESLLVSEALGRTYERLDVTSIERPD